MESNKELPDITHRDLLVYQDYGEKKQQVEEILSRTYTKIKNKYYKATKSHVYTNK